MISQRLRGRPRGVLFLSLILFIVGLSVATPAWAHQETGSTAASPGLHFLELFSEGRQVVVDADRLTLAADSALYTAKEGVTGVPWWARLEPLGQRRRPKEIEGHLYCVLPMEVTPRELQIRIELQGVIGRDQQELGRAALYRLRETGESEVIHGAFGEVEEGLAYRFELMRPGRYLFIARLASVPPMESRLSVVARPAMEQAN